VIVFSRFPFSKPPLVCFVCFPLVFSLCLSCPFGWFLLTFFNPRFICVPQLLRPPLSFFMVHCLRASKGRPLAAVFRFSFPMSDLVHFPAPAPHTPLGCLFGLAPLPLRFFAQFAPFSHPSFPTHLSLRRDDPFHHRFSTPLRFLCFLRLSRRTPVHVYFFFPFDVRPF